MRVGQYLVVVVIGAAFVVACGASNPGPKLYADLGCPSCHGKSLQGNRDGPALKKLDEYWSSDTELVRYMQDPKGTIEGIDRLQQQAHEYKLRMLPVKNASEKDLQQLAAWLRSVDKTASS